MKTTFILTFLVAAIFPLAAAPVPKIGDYKGANKAAIPGNAYGVYTVADAKAEAVKKKKALAFLITDERADEPAIKLAGTKTFWAIEDDAIIVVLRASTIGAWDRLPEVVVKTIKAKALGTTLPKLVVFNDDASVALASIGSEKLVDTSDKDLNKFGKEVKKLNASKTASTDFPPPDPDAVKPAAVPPVPAASPPPVVPAPAPGTPAAPAPAPAGPVVIKDSKLENWSNAEGKPLSAALVEVNGDDIVFLIGGNKVPYSLSKLSAESQKRVEALKAASK